ncbi:unnamed protein product [Brassica rapa subsp. trilocularis]|uniref:(rape) hypothetical protein n=2 Tax=Brassica napus TaxID=3708 RepID=A0A078IJ65_BRANA|nr:unnamed protein product [Brassica napus]CDY49459.1 BnaA10g06490D [Brassica napus]
MEGRWSLGNVLGLWKLNADAFVVAEPEIQIDHEAEFLVIAADGLWDVVPNEDAVSLAQSEEEPEAAARKLTFTASTRGSADSITCIVVKFRQHELKSNLNAETGTESSPKAETEPNQAPKLKRN